MRAANGLIKIVCHSQTVLKLARKMGWLAGASYVNLRNIRGFEPVGLIDVDWESYDFRRHLQAVKSCRPVITIARDIVRMGDLDRTLDQAYELAEWVEAVIVVPKARKLGNGLSELIPRDFVLGYSVPTRYGGTRIPLERFRGRPVHLLGGRPDVQRRIADHLSVVSLDVNRFTLDAKFGDFFDGQAFRRHPVGGYIRCLRDSIRNIDSLWENYANGESRVERFQDKESGCERPFAN